MRDVMEGEQYIFNREEKYKKLDAILNQCEADWHAGKGPFAPDPNRPRIIISGAGLGGVAGKTVEVLEELGGAVVCYEGCSGIVSRRRLIDESEDRDPIACIAEKYLEVPCAVKVVNGGSSIGVALPDTKEELEKALHEMLRYGSHIIVEKILLVYSCQ